MAGWTRQINRGEWGTGFETSAQRAAQRVSGQYGFDARIALQAADTVSLQPRPDSGSVLHWKPAPTL
nr:Uncharacterised protein [Klebsiella pneumoniae]